MSSAIEIDSGEPLERILVVTAHPDDVDFGAAGSVASWVHQGSEVHYCIVTDGDAGGSDRSISRSEMAALRREEQRAAAAAVGVKDVTFLGYPDGSLTPSIELRADISRVVRQVRPQRVIAQSPDRDWERIGASHPDHLAAGEATVCVAYPDARNPFAHRHLLEDEGLEPWTVSEVWLMASPKSNRAVDVTEFFSAKLDALRCHRSQVGEGEWLDDLLRQWMDAGAVKAGLPQGRLAETFQVVEMPWVGTA